MQNGSAELPVALLLYVLNLYGDAKFTRIFGTPILVNFGTVIVECKNLLLSSNEELNIVYIVCVLNLHGDAKFTRIFGMYIKFIGGCKIY